MALANFTVPAIEVATPALAASSSVPLRVELDDLLYSPEEQQPEYAAQYTGNEPFKPPPNIQQPRKSKLRKRAGTAYLPPPNQFTHYPQQSNGPQNPFNSQLHTQIYQQNMRLDLQIDNQRVQDINGHYDNTGQYFHDPTGDYDYDQRKNGKNAPQRPPYNPGYADVPFPPATEAGPTSSRRFDGISNPNFNNVNGPATPPPQTASRKQNEAGNKISSNSDTNGQIPPDRPRGFTKVETGGSGGKTQLHAILDYDDDDYYEDVPGSGNC
ncbi:unnamed protein product [Euphydryas editha]|uniref:Uncharacterized protein n=1 Tax=Euphydryas editha TaxID=104508 RepID=A0AAU9TYS8_EUPED|nr:unnamed protein product [Euphydryas editha]